MTNAQQPGQPWRPFTSDLQAANYYAGRLNLIKEERGLEVVQEAIRTWWTTRIVPGVKIALKAKGYDDNPSVEDLIDIFSRKTDVIWAEQKLRNITSYMDDVVKAFDLGAPLPTFAIRDAMELLGVPPEQLPAPEPTPPGVVNAPSYTVGPPMPQEAPPL